MAYTVRKLLESEQFPKMKLLCGEKGLDLEVKGIRIIEIEDTIDIYKGIFGAMCQKKGESLSIPVVKCKLRSNGMPVPLLRNGYSIFNGTKYR